MIAECLLIRDENHLLLEHLAYNAAAGVEHFFIYDNMSETPVADFLRENARDFLNICTVARYQGRGNLQIDCYADYLQEHRHVDWTLFCDTDEIFVGNIRDAVADFGSDYNCLSFSPILHGCNGKIYDDGGGMFERFGNDVADPAHHWYKFVARTADIASISNVHYCKMPNKKMSFSFPFIRGMAAENQQRQGDKPAAERQTRSPRFFQREPDNITGRPRSRGINAEIRR